jgi:ABC-2 type transport system permease protein
MTNDQTPLGFRPEGAMLGRIWTLIIKELIQLRRNTLLWFMAIFGALLETALVAYSGSVPIEHLPLAVLDQDRTWASRALVVALENTETFDANYYLTDLNEVRRLIDRGKATAAVVIPRGFAEQLDDPLTPPPQVQVIVDGSDSTAAGTAVGAAEGAVARFGQEVSLQAMDVGEDEMMSIVTNMRVWFNEEMKKSNYTTPSEAGFIVGAIAAMIAAAAVAREREMGTLEQLMVTPLRPIEMLIGKSAAAILVGYTEFVLVVLMIHFVFEVPMRGSWTLLWVLSLFYMLVELSWGLVVSAFADNQLQALLLVFCIIMVMMTFSGYAYPVDTMPRAMQLVSNIFPIRHWLVVFRSIMLKGAGIADFWPRLLAIAALGILMMSAAVLVLGRKVE